MDEPTPTEHLSALAHFGVEVKEARLARKLGQKHLAAGAGYSIAYVSKVEHGVLVPSEGFAERCDVVFETNGLFQRLWRRIKEEDPPTWFAPYLDLEPKASRIYDWSVHCLIGPLQTEEYTRAIFRAGNPRDTSLQIEAKVRDRTRRRDRLALDKPSGPALWSVIHEACVRAVVGGPAVMAAQVEHLLSCAELPRVDLQVMPLGRGAHAAHMPAFTLLRFTDGTPPTLWADTPLGGRLYQGEDAIMGIAEVHERMRSHALSPDDSLGVLRKIREEHLRWST
jgi:transcriptional regulator with XRE-family HTH domain